MDLRFYSGVMTCLETRLSWWLYSTVNVLIATELYTFKWLILCYVDFTYIQREGKRNLEKEWAFCFMYLPLNPRCHSLGG